MDQLSVGQWNAIDLIVANPGIKQKEVATSVGVSLITIRNWFTNPAFTTACYERFMQLRETRLMSVLDSMFREAEEGSVAAARLIFEHYGRLEKKLTLTIKSPFEIFDTNQKLGNIQEADFTEDIAKELALNHIKTTDLPPRNPEANGHYRKIQEGKRIKRRVKTTKQKMKKNKNQNVRYHLRNRANAVKLPMLPPGKPKKEKRMAWMRELKKREHELGIIYPD